MPSGTKPRPEPINVNPDLCCYMASQGHNELTILSRGVYLFTSLYVESERKKKCFSICILCDVHFMQIFSMGYDALVAMIRTNILVPQF